MNKFIFPLSILVLSLVSKTSFSQVSEPVLWSFSSNGGTQVLSSKKTEDSRGLVDVYEAFSSVPYMTIRSPKRYNLFGIVSSSASDIDGDGYDDILVGAPLSGSDASNPGSVHVYSGATGQEFLRLPGYGKDNYFGRSVAGAGDIDGDSVPDLLVGGWFISESNTPYGRIYVISGASGKLLRTITSYESGDGFGYTVVSLGDLNEDGIPEIAISAPLAETQASGTGAVYIFDLAESSFKHLSSANATNAITNSDDSRDLFGSILAYDDQLSTATAHAILIGSVDPVSYSTDIAQFIFSHHKIKTQDVLAETSVSAKVSGDVTKDGKTTSSDLNAVVNSMAGTGAELDLDGDGQMTVLDVAVVLANYGEESSVISLLSDPSPLLSRISELTDPTGMLKVVPIDSVDGIDLQPWDKPDCDDDDDDGDGSGGLHPEPVDIDGIQPQFPGVRPGVIGGGNPALWSRGPMAPPGIDPPDGCDDDDECEEGDPDCDDGGGGSDCGCELPDDVEDGDCNAFIDFGGPKYVGRGLSNDSFYANLTSGDWVASLSGSSDSGVTSVTSSESGIGNYIGSADFIDEAGSRTLKWIAYNSSTGVVVRKCFTVEVVDYEPIEFEYRTFIPCEVIPFELAPGGMIPPIIFFAGDDRYSCIINWVLFNPSSVSARTSFRSSVVNDGLVWNRPNPPFSGSCEDVNSKSVKLDNLDTAVGASHRYYNPPLNGLVTAVPTVCTPLLFGPSSYCTHDLVAGALPAATDTAFINPIFWRRIIGDFYTTCYYEPAVDNHMNGAYQFRLYPDEVCLKYIFSVNNPLAPGSPTIDGNVEIRLSWSINQDTGVQTVSYVLSGNADQFPAHEIFLNDNIVNLYNPYRVGAGPMDLLDLWWETPRLLVGSGDVILR